MLDRTSADRRWAVCLLLFAWAALTLPFWRAFSSVVRLSLQDERYSHLIVIPLFSVGLLVLEGRRIFPQRRLASGFGALLLAMAALAYCVARPWSQESGAAGQLWLSTLALVAAWIAAFAFLNGRESTAAAIFPLCVLLLMIPVPASFMDRCVVGLQKASAEVTYVIFKILGTPVLRHGFTFALPGVNIEIAEECSGIHSTIALLLTGILAAHLFLRSSVAQIGMIFLTIPVAIFKNAVRIVTLSWLSVYVDRGILDSPLHHRGGAIFGVIGLAILVPLLLLLRKVEARARIVRQPQGASTKDFPLPAAKLPKGA